MKQWSETRVVCYSCILTFHWLWLSWKLTERLLPIPVVRGSNPVIGKIYIEHLLSTVLKKRKLRKRGRECPFKKHFMLDHCSYNWPGSKIYKNGNKINGWQQTLPLGGKTKNTKSIYIARSSNYSVSNPKGRCSDVLKADDSRFFRIAPWVRNFFGVAVILGVRAKAGRIARNKNRGSGHFLFNRTHLEEVLRWRPQKRMKYFPGRTLDRSILKLESIDFKKNEKVEMMFTLKKTSWRVAWRWNHQKWLLSKIIQSSMKLDVTLISDMSCLLFEHKESCIFLR